MLRDIRFCGAILCRGEGQVGSLCLATRPYLSTPGLEYDLFMEMPDPKPPRYMSDKAKGKQRAEPIDLAALASQSKISAPTQDYSPNIKFSIRFTDGAHDLRLELPTTKRVAALVDAVSPSLANGFTTFSIS